MDRNQISSHRLSGGTSFPAVAASRIQVRTRTPLPKRSPTSIKEAFLQTNGRRYCLPTWGGSVITPGFACGVNDRGEVVLFSLRRRRFLEKNHSRAPNAW